ncbi:hypothetical protein APY94_10385 [Thermococcus celericrescens]|uniref:Uncharacterized protein n=1 Tax=Thermococcus celericrescens TaxID=227598 RepID=A0A100XW98_9EURY|nr:hypothetical protein [Thermococcus celericrescens]KUH32295.1 hypothetical protein APY94_10385 [Thermococcus celericrescens]
MEKGGKPRISYETTFRVKVLILTLIFGIAIFMIVYYPIISHQVDPFKVESPRGQVLLAQNFSIAGVTYTNAVPFTAENNALVLGGSDELDDTLTITVSTPQWCVDLWTWGGSANGWVRKYDCARELQLSKYAFNRVPTHEAKEIARWSLEPGYVLVFHKNGPVQKYEIVNFTVTYGGETDWGAFKVSVKSS